jgi:hypothetical protein
MIPPTKIRVRRGIPFLFILDRALLPHQFLRKMLATWNWKLIGYGPQYYRLKIGKYSLKLRPEHFEIIFGEWQDWKRYYLPPFTLDGTTVLDVGAGCGETALFYFLHGARRVICVESNPHLANIAIENVETNNWSADVLARPFDLGILKMKFDFMKIDCEGCEAQLLNAELLPACVMEVHGRDVLDALTSRFDLEVPYARTEKETVRHDDFAHRQRRMYYLGWRFTKARNRYYRERGLRKLYCAFILMILELHPDFVNVYRARWGRVWEAYYFPFEKLTRPRVGAILSARISAASQNEHSALAVKSSVQAAVRLLIITPRFSPPETYEEHIAARVNPHLDEYTHVAIVDADTEVPEDFYHLPEKHPDADIIAAKVIPTSRVYRVWETLTYGVRLSRYRLRGAAVIYSTEFLKRVRGYPRVGTPDTWLYTRADRIVQDPMRVYHRESFNVRHSLSTQVRSGKARAEMGQPAWRVAAHSIFRLRPLVLFTYLYYRARIKS